MRIVIIGAEAAGASAAAKARRLAPEAEIVVYEQSTVAAFGACGLPYFVGGFFQDPGDMVSRTVEQFRQGGIAIRTGHTVFALNARNKTVSVRNNVAGLETEEPYDRLMLATGAAPVIPPVENLGLENVFHLKVLEDGLALRQAVLRDDVRDVVIVGAGFIGLETVEAMKILGKNVRLIQLDDRVLGEYFDAEITGLMERTLATSGVAVHVSETVLALHGQGRVRGVRTNKGDYPANLVVICVGVRPNTAPFRDCGLDMLQNGAIVVDGRGHTSLADVYAAGDCATVLHLVKQAPAYIPLATTANKLGRVVGENLAGGDAVFPGTLGTAAVRVLGLEAGRTGLTEAEAVTAGLPVKAAFVTDKNHSNYLPGQTEIHAKLVYHAVTRKLLGGQVAGGAGAALRTDVLAAAIWGGLTVDQLRMMDLLYAPPFSRPWDVINIAANAAR
jgi:NADPH-dependent 2,4-dienoyl-CoA reductase/sulfur reductase-like enzyme